MSEVSLHVMPILLRTTVALGLAAVGVRLLLCLARPHSPLIHRIAWASVLCQGVLFAQWTLEVPWYESTGVSAETVSHELPTLGAQYNRPANGNAQRTSAQAHVEAAASWSWKSVLMVIWIGGMVLLLGVAATSYAMLLRAVRSACPAHSEWQDQWQQMLTKHGIRAKVPLLMHDKLGPLLCRLPSGYCVVCPQAVWSEFSPVQRHTILQHELAHFQRGDIWKSLAIRLTAVPHWFNPFAWWAVAKFEEGGEWACDQRLAESDPQQLPQFARALLEIVEPQSRRICASAARGASLTIRLRRLFAFQVSEDSVMKRSLFTVLLLCLGGFGLFRLHLVAREQDKVARSVPQAARAAEMERFAARLNTENSQLLGEFQRTLATQAGKIVLQDRVAHVQQELRNDARDEAVPRFLQERFRRDGQTLALREGQTAFRKELLQTAAGFNEDVGRMMPVVQQLAKQMSDQTELDRLVARFLKHDRAPAMLYVEQLRQRLRPDVSLIERALGQVFTRNRQGKFVVRPGRRAQAEEYLEKMQQVLRVRPRIQEELQSWSNDFAGVDKLDQQVKQVMSEEMFSLLIASKVVGEHEGNPMRRINQFFEQLEALAVDTGDGLSVREEQREEVRELLDEYRKVRAAKKTLAAPVRSFADQIEPGRELEDGWRKVLNSDLALMRLADEMELSGADPGEAVRRLLGQVLRKGDDGRLHVRTDESEEEVAEFVRELFRMSREVRRRGRVIDEHAAQLADREMRSALESLGGKFVVIQMVQRSLRGADFDGLRVWVEHHFEAVDGRLTLRTEAEPEIRQMIREARELQEELAKDDF